MKLPYLFYSRSRDIFEYWHMGPQGMHKYFKDMYYDNNCMWTDDWI